MNNKNTRTKYEICSKLTIKTPEGCWRRSTVFIVNFEHISHLVLTPCSTVSIVNFEHVIGRWVEIKNSSINIRFYKLCMCKSEVVWGRRDGERNPLTIFRRPRKSNSSRWKCLGTSEAIFTGKTRMADVYLLLSNKRKRAVKPCLP